MILSLAGRKAECVIVVSRHVEDVYVTEGYWLDNQDVALSDAECQAIGEDNYDDLGLAWLESRIDAAESAYDASRDGSY